MQELCWGDEDRVRKLKETFQTDVSFLETDLLKNESDTCSEGRTSCSTSHDDIWDDDEMSTIGFSCSESHTGSKSPSPVLTKDDVSESLQLALDVCQANWIDRRNERKTQQQSLRSRLHESPMISTMKNHESYVRTLRAATVRLRRVLPIVVPADLCPPSDYELRSANSLMKHVNAIAPLPTSDELLVKYLVINDLQRMVDLWLRRTLNTMNGIPADCSNDSTTTATLLLGGSWHLKVGTVESDLDVVALMPHHVTADIFFSSLCEHLRREASVSKLVARRKAAVPVLSFELSTVRVDLLFARYAQKQAVPKHLPFLPGDDMHVMRGMDMTSVRSLSVARVASFILELVPNLSVFKSCLRVIRQWARLRGLYSNKAGYLGGISWALLVCFVCQMFPRANVAALVHRFFSVMASWHWPTPILVARPSNGCSADSVQWNPQHNIHDRAHLMPIITPGFPAFNTAVNVNLSTLRVMREEFARGQRIMDDLRHRNLSYPSSWNQLFNPTEVLLRYDHYVVIELRALNEESLAEWSSFVASRTRKLVETLHHTPLIASLHPLPELVRPRNRERNESKSAIGYYVIGYSINMPPVPQSRRDNCQQVIRPTVPFDSNHEKLAKNCVTLATRYFLATELTTATEKRSGMEVKVSYRAWNNLPNTIFSHGRTAAVGDRARYILNQAHQVNLASGFTR